MSPRPPGDDTVSIPEASAEDEPTSQIPYRDILRHQMSSALREFERPYSGLAASAFSAGLDIGFGPFLMAVYLTMAGSDSDPATRLALALLYSFGFVFVVLGRSELFTEHTTMAVLPVLAGHARVSELLRVWVVIWAANIVGTLVFAGSVTFIGTRLGIVERWAFADIAMDLTDQVWWIMLLSAVLAGWLMGLLTWLVGATRETIGQIVIIVLTAASIGLAGLHHSIAGSVEVLFGVFTRAVTPSEFMFFLVWVTIGNALGGSIFVALIKYSHVVRSKPEPDESVVGETA